MVHLFRNKLDAELVQQSSGVSFPDSAVRSQTAFCCGVMAAVGKSSQPMSSSSCPNSRSNSAPWSSSNLRGTPKDVIQCLKRWSQTTFGCMLGTMRATPKVLARSRMFMKPSWFRANSASTNKSMAAVSPNSQLHELRPSCLQ